ncbi:MAG: AGE family epimerase/isomerase [Chloroflexi bacterium]|nr:AGE family epimerase/isomerase [Chloroflexota bacterium]
MSINFTTLLEQYRSELLDRTIPFWLKYGLDWKNGGINTGIADEGEVLSTDKYMWSQLRAIFTFSALYNRIERRKEWLDVAEQIFDFTKRCGRDEDGCWVFLVDKDGKQLQGATSIYADAFAIYGFTELAKATGNPEAVRLARETYLNVSTRLASPGSYPTAPHPIPVGLKAHGVAMTFALVFDELGHYLDDPTIKHAALDHANQVMTVFLRPERQRLYEFMRLDDSLLELAPGRTVNPGHVVESMWFMIHIYQRLGNQARIRQAIDAIKWHIEFGWDDEFGGIFLARDAEGSRWEKIADTKIWWPHTEALYALLLAYSISKEQWCLDWFERVHDYAFSHFPVPQYGEWIQNLDRQGNKLDATVGLPVKDPFHLARALVNCIGVLEPLAKIQ